MRAARIRRLHPREGPPEPSPAPRPGAPASRPWEAAVCHSRPRSVDLWGAGAETLLGLGRLGRLSPSFCLSGVPTSSRPRLLFGSQQRPEDTWRPWGLVPACRCLQSGPCGVHDARTPSRRCVGVRRRLLAAGLDRRRPRPSDRFPSTCHGPVSSPARVTVLSSAGLSALCCGRQPRVWDATPAPSSTGR